MSARRQRVGATAVVGVAFIVIVFCSLMYQRQPLPRPSAGPVPPSESSPEPTPTSPAASPRPDAKEPAACLTTSRAVPDSYAWEATSQGAFGPTAYTPTSKADDAMGELIDRLCGRPWHGPDRRLYAAVSSAASPGHLDPNRRLNKRQWVTGVNRFVKHLMRARAHIEPLTAGTSGVTMFAATRLGHDPHVGITRLPTSAAHLLVFKTQGVLLKLKLECGFQPVATSHSPPWVNP